jgi:predicted RNase H-like HicB family nuclease
MKYYPAIFETNEGKTVISFPNFPGVSGIAKDDYAAAVVAKHLLSTTMKDYVAEGIEVTEPIKDENFEVHGDGRLMLVPAPSMIGPERPYHDSKDEPGLALFHLLLQQIEKQDWNPVIDANGAMIIDDEAPENIKDWAING